MPKEQTWDQAESSHIHDSANETHNNESHLITRNPVENTPFAVVGNNENGYFLTMGKYRLTDNFQNEEDVIYYLENNTWEIIVTLMTAIIHASQTHKIEMK